MSIRLLLVEDDDVHRETLTRHLRRAGFDVTAVGDGHSALAVRSMVQPDVILTDVRMPGMTGLELLASVKASTDSPPVIVMTAFGDMQVTIDAMKLGAYDYQTKPLDLDVLDTVLARCCEELRRLRPQPQHSPASQAGLLVGADPRMVEIYKTIGTIAPTRAAVLIRGETGTGKELIARTIHANGPTSTDPFVAVNCTAVPESLLESELFGHARGSFTGAIANRRGRFQLAGSGTIFLDEIGDTSVNFQSKLLRVLQEKEYLPVGEERPRPTNARVIAATHRPMEALVGEGTFREDLYFRLRVVEIVIPPLRDRRGDIPLLAAHIVAKVGAELNRELFIPDDVMAALLCHDWPGNVRELENALRRAAVLTRGSALSAVHLGLGTSRQTEVVAASPDEDQSLDTVERIHVQRVLAQSGRNKSRAAQLLGVSRPRLDRMIERHRLVV